MADLVEDLRFRGLIHQMTDPALGERLDAGMLTGYTGFDPTADSLHVGHLLQVCNLRRLQVAGHRPIAVAGGGTGFVGDPGGKSEERSLLTDEQLEANLAGIHAQLGRFLDFGRPTDGVDGRCWSTTPTGSGHCRSSTSSATSASTSRSTRWWPRSRSRVRLDRADQGISYTEFSYMLLQAYDFLHLFDDLRLPTADRRQRPVGQHHHGHRPDPQGPPGRGLGTDHAAGAEGRRHQVRQDRDPARCGWTPPGPAPYQLYQFFLRTEDAMVGTYLRYFTFLSHEAILALDEATAEHPERREAQRVLAREVCTLVHGADETARAEEAAAALFGETVAGLDERTLLDVFADAPSTSIDRTRLDGGPDAGRPAGRDRTGAVQVQGPVHRRSRGGAYVNNKRERDAGRTVVDRRDLVAGRYLVLRKGKKRPPLGQPGVSPPGSGAAAPGEGRRAKSGAAGPVLH